MSDENTADATTAPPNPAGNLPLLLTIEQVAATLQVNPRTIRRWIDAGDLVSHQFGRGYRVSEADLQAFIRLSRRV
jgi:excisionase family DNA binding protein